MKCVSGVLLINALIASPSIASGSEIGPAIPNGAVPCIYSEPTLPRSYAADARFVPNATSPARVGVKSTVVRNAGYVQNGDRVTGDPGMTIKISRSSGTQFSVGVSASATAEAGLVFARASATAGISLTHSWTTTRTEERSWTVPNNGRRGWISIGSDKYEVTAVIQYSGSRCETSQKTKKFYAISSGASFKIGQF